MVSTWNYKWIWISYLYIRMSLNSVPIHTWSHMHLILHQEVLTSTLDQFVPHLYCPLRLMSSSFYQHCVIFDKSGSRQTFCVWSFKYNHRWLKDFDQQTLWPLNFVYSECCTLWRSCSPGLRQCSPCQLRSGISYATLHSFLQRCLAEEFPAETTLFVVLADTLFSSLTQDFLTSRLFSSPHFDLASMPLKK